MGSVHPKACAEGGDEERGHASNATLNAFSKVPKRQPAQTRTHAPKADNAPKAVIAASRRATNKHAKRDKQSHKRAEIVSKAEGHHWPPSVTRAH